MNHYDVLGVPRHASTAEVRQAYLGLVRVHHPDRHAGAASADRAEAEEQMRRINEAWRELGDPQRRTQYDEALDARTDAVLVGQDPGPTWQPFDDAPDDFVDDRLDESQLPPPRGGRLLTMAPPATLAIGVALTLIGIVVGVREVLAAGVMAVILGAGLFVVVPLSIILESRRNDLR